MSAKKQTDKPEDVDEIIEQPNRGVGNSKFQNPNTNEDEMDELEDEVEQEIESLRSQWEVAEAKYRRALADYQNLERVTAEAQRRFAKIATQGFVEDLIVPYDNLLLAAKHIKDKGLDMVLSQFRQVFESQGLGELNPIGQLFDPSLMEAIETKEGEDGKVLEVLSGGYELNGVVIRPARVVVGKNKQ